MRGWMGMFLIQLRRDLTLAARLGGGGLLAVAFFVVLVTLVPFGVGAEPALLSKLAIGMIWVGVVLSTLLSLDRLFQADYEDGSLDLIYLSPQPLGLLVLAKCAAYWITTALPLIVVAPLLGVLLNLPAENYGFLVLSLLVGTPALSLVGAVGAALTVGLRRGSLLLSLLVLPLCVPTLIFGAAAAGGHLNNFYLLGAVSLVFLVVSPIASSAALKLNLG
ncbi:MAG: heme exporter protein CcmB [Alphaproteobacteria bacterium]|nr:MAG: heme exporter protein CcmB [Alphaproteobacteria bacterium]